MPGEKNMLPGGGGGGRTKATVSGDITGDAPGKAGVGLGPVLGGHASQRFLLLWRDRGCVAQVTRSFPLGEHPWWAGGP